MKPRSPPADRSNCARSNVAAEVVLSERAAATLSKAPAKVRAQLLQALAAIEDDHDWGARPTRFLAPATSPHSGYIVDLAVQGWAIVYRAVDRGAHVEVPTIDRIFLG